MLENLIIFVNDRNETIDSLSYWYNLIHILHIASLFNIEIGLLVHIEW